MIDRLRRRSAAVNACNRLHGTTLESPPPAASDIRLESLAHPALGQPLAGKALAIKADATDASVLAGAIDLAASHFGRLDILVNSAGVLAMAPLEKFSLEDFDRTVAVNIRSVFIASRAAARQMKDGGRIINIGSTKAPGPVDTDMNPGSGDFAAALHGLMAIPRHGKAEEIAGMVAYLVSAEAAFVTGADLLIDGGFAA